MTFMNTRSYQVLGVPSSHVYEEKRSLFTVMLEPASTREQAMTALSTIRENHPGASHYCWAYILGSTEQPISMAFSDDGEPAGTAGKPILHVLTHRKAGNCLAVVVRIFGGVKLGAAGLVRAYGASVSQALDHATWEELTPTQKIVISVSFAFEERIRHCLTTHQISVASVAYNTEVELTVDAPFNYLENLKKEVQQLTSGQGHIRVCPE